MKEFPLVFISLLLVFSACQYRNPVFALVFTALDQEFNQISEISLKPEHALLFDGLPYLSFVRKGMLYIFLNQEDEMSFVRFKPKFKKI